jgi:hypothetical protein
MKLRPLMVLLTLSLPFTAQAQGAPADEPTANIDDVVVVRGWRHPVQLRLRMVEAELAVYDLFNQFNDNASLQLECHKRNVGGTRLQTTDCMPRFESQALAQEGRDTLEVYRASLNAMAVTGMFSTVFPGPMNQASSEGSGDQGQFLGYTPTVMAIPAKQAIYVGQTQLQQKMRLIATEHPEFVEAVKTYVDAKARYTQALRRDD